MSFKELGKYLHSEQATCEVCGLTARTKDELEDHIHRSHSDSNRKISFFRTKNRSFSLTFYVIFLAHEVK
jgi:hypothetical protein